MIGIQSHLCDGYNKLLTLGIKCLQNTFENSTNQISRTMSDQLLRKFEILENNSWKQLLKIRWFNVIVILKTSVIICSYCSGSVVAKYFLSGVEKLKNVNLWFFMLCLLFCAIRIQIELGDSHWFRYPLSGF